MRHLRIEFEAVVNDRDEYNGDETWTEEVITDWLIGTLRTDLGESLISVRRIDLGEEDG